MDLANVVGQTLDEKYQMTRELGRGGMGTVYLATHVGTERPVAVKVIAPQFMARPEFVERFRREARAAGRLRHPNVVNVTDFGFASTDEGQVAYLVMEYLDGCTLGEILEEEKNLPVGFTLDILDQVCSAVHEAHEQGIIHRDLKPDNIWLEPNQRGGYTVKVLDFGIAKLEEQGGMDSNGEEIHISAMPTSFYDPKLTVADASRDETIHDSAPSTRVIEPLASTRVSEVGTGLFESKTLIQPDDNGKDKSTAILNIEPAVDPDTIGTRLISDVGTSGESVPRSFAATTDLTRVGAVLGTPLYMSPEQCRGERLDARSDVYSLGVIAYQMLSGATPFSGDFTRVMEAHKECPPPPLEAKKVRKKLKRVIATALEKNPDDRPQTAEAFASILRSRSEGIFGLLRRAAMIYTEHMPKFLMLSAFFHLPMVMFTAGLILFSFLRVSELINSTVAGIGMGISGAGLSLITPFCAYLITGTITWIVTQSMAVPLRPIKLRASLREARLKWKRFLGAGLLSTVLSVVAAGVFFGVAFTIPFLLLWMIAGMSGLTAGISAGIGIVAACIGFAAVSILLMLTASVVMMESTGILQSLRRSTNLIRRSTVTATAAFLIMFLIPFITAGGVSLGVKHIANNIYPEEKVPAQETTESGQPEPKQGIVGFSIDADAGLEIKKTGGNRSPFRDALSESILQILLLPMQIVMISFTAIIVALLYLKTRLAGGESLGDLFNKFEEAEQPRKKWQERVRQRLIQSGRITSKS